MSSPQIQKDAKDNTPSKLIRTIPELPRGLAIMILLCNIFFLQVELSIWDV